MPFLVSFLGKQKGKKTEPTPRLNKRLYKENKGSIELTGLSLNVRYF